MAATFSDTLDAVDQVEGWMTPGQARLLWDAAGRVGAGGRIVEIGSFRGRSTIVLGRAAADGVEVVAIDPHAGNDRGPQELAGYEAEAVADHEAFRANLAAAGVAHRVTHLRAFSHDALAEVGGPVDLLYVDGAHRYRPAAADLRDWGARVRPGGTLLVHDSFSAIGVTLALARHQFGSARYRYLGRSRSLAQYRRLDRPMGSAARLANAGRQAAQLPWFAANLVLKALIASRVLRRDWPY